MTIATSEQTVKQGKCEGRGPESPSVIFEHFQCTRNHFKMTVTLQAKGCIAHRDHFNHKSHDRPNSANIINIKT